jgi:hypothetical protein
MLLIALHLLLPLHSDITKGWHLLVKLGTVQLFSVAYWRKKINPYVNIFVTNIIWAFLRIYITTGVIKQAELEFLRLYKVLPPAVSTSQDEKPVLAFTRQVQCHSALCSLQPAALSIGQSGRQFRIPSIWCHMGLVRDKVTPDQAFVPFYSVLLC